MTDILKIIATICVSLVAIVLASENDFTGEEHPIMAIIVEIIGLYIIFGSYTTL